MFQSCVRHPNPSPLVLGWQVFASLVQPVVIAVPLPMPHRATRARRATADVQGDNDVLVTIPKATGSELLAVSARGLVR